MNHEPFKWRGVEFRFDASMGRHTAAIRLTDSSVLWFNAKRHEDGTWSAWADNWPPTVHHGTAQKAVEEAASRVLFKAQRTLEALRDLGMNQ